MGDDSEWQKLPTDEKVQHKVTMLHVTYSSSSLTCYYSNY